MDQYPDFETAFFLESHIQSTLAFYDPRVVAADGGFYGCFLDNGDCYDLHSRQLVGSARYVVNYATAYRLQGKPQYLEWATSGLAFLTNSHKQENGYYAWLLEHGAVSDSRVMAYGHAFVILAAAACLRAGVRGALAVLSETFDFMEQYFWDEAGGAYADERNATLETLSPYRGQNANMHMCEALFAAWQASGDERYLNRSEQLAKRFTFELAGQSNGKVWEHYDANWCVDMLYNIDAPNDRYKPWGFQPGHQFEWSKLLLQLNEVRPDKSWIAKAQQLYDQAINDGWDKVFGGIVYGLAPNNHICASEKYFWVQAEAFATAWRLYKVTGEAKYRSDYFRIWQWSWDYMIDHKYGAWYRVRNCDGSAIDDKKSPLGKTDYHTMGACWDILSVGV